MGYVQIARGAPLILSRAIMNDHNTLTWSDDKWFSLNMFSLENKFKHAGEPLL